MDVTVVICTRNKASSLRKGLQSLARTKVPPGVEVELLVVDNNSTDGTAEQVQSHAPKGWPVRCVVEEQSGLSHARNRAVVEAKGRVLLFTDDDVRVPRDWIGPMTAPILRGEADAVAGGVRLADELRREWMTVGHLMMMADTEVLRTSDGTRLVGANMAVSRAIFRTIPRFDPHLGAGPTQLGFHEETLFSLQMQRAGFRLTEALDIIVDHYPDKERILYSGFASTMAKQGCSDAYLHYHWQHTSGSRFRSLGAVVFWGLRLAMYRAIPQRRRAPTDEGMALTEMKIRRRLAYHRHMLRLLGTPRRYHRLSHRLQTPSASEHSEQRLPLAEQTEYNHRPHHNPIPR